jgi:hypothetical protein
MKKLSANLDFKVLAAGLALLVVSNVVALAGVAYNRQGEPDAVIELTERELRMPFYYGMRTENTGLGLEINCRLEDRSRTYDAGNRECFGNPRWLDEAKLGELGFHLRTPIDSVDRYVANYQYLPREVYLVLEYDGEAYRRALARKQAELDEQRALLEKTPADGEVEKRVKYARERLQLEQSVNSRLFAIDAGLDRDGLRKRYADAGRYPLMKALVRPVWSTSGEDKTWTGSITDLLIDTVNIPLQYRGVFDPLRTAAWRDPVEQTPRYKVRLAFGKRLEPWVLDAQELPDKK